MSAAAGALVGAIGSGAGGVLMPWLARRLPAPYANAAPPIVRTVVLSLVSGALTGASVGLHWPLLYLVPLVPVAVLLALLDQELHLIPTVVVWPALAGVVVLAVAGALAAGDPGALLGGLEGAALTGAVFYALWWIRPASMGFGDVRLSVVIGFALGCLGWAELLYGVYAGFVLFSLVAVGKAVVRRDRGQLRQPSPYGPAMLGGALVGVALASYLASR